jgi:hypothetical protein
MESNVLTVKLIELTILGKNNLLKQGNFYTIENRDNLIRKNSNFVKSKIKIEAKVATYVTLKRGR